MRFSKPVTALALDGPLKGKWGEAHNDTIRAINIQGDTRTEVIYYIRRYYSPAWQGILLSFWVSDLDDLANCRLPGWAYPDNEVCEL